MAADTSSMWDPAAQRGGGNRALQVARCSLCDLERPIGLMVADGGEACDDLRWYCKDAKSCTLRWTSRPPEPPAGTGPPAGTAPASVGEAPVSQASAGEAPSEPARADQPACHT